VDYAARLRAAGKPVEVRDFDGQQHGFCNIDPWSDASAELMRVIKRFVDSDGRFD
jgi:acetyl esterase/lipase